MELWNDELPNVAPTLNISPEMLTQLAEDYANFAYLRSFSNALASHKESYQDFKDIIFDDPNELVPEAPAFNSVTMPGPYKSGIIPRARALAQYIKASPGYTDQLGELLDLVVDNPDNIQPGDILPVLKPEALNTGNVEIKFSKQGLDAMKIFWRPKGEQEWQDVGSFMTSPAVHVVTYASSDKQPMALEYRGILLKKDQPVSQYSQIASIVTTP